MFYVFGKHKKRDNLQYMLKIKSNEKRKIKPSEKTTKQEKAMNRNCENQKQKQKKNVIKSTSKKTGLTRESIRQYRGLKKNKTNNRQKKKAADYNTKGSWF